jgi:hypothetical protein
MITKGPWKREGWEIIGGDGAIIAKLLPWDSSGCRGEDNDNADLIAKAPQTLCRLAEVEAQRDELKGLLVSTMSRRDTFEMAIVLHRKIDEALAKLEEK